MKKFSFIFIIIFLLVSCVKDNGLTERPSGGLLPSDDPQLAVVLERLNGVIDDLYGPSTRSGRKRSIASITPFTTASTRVDDLQNLAYVVNFEDNNGFAVISTHPLSDDIITVSNSGS